jgi:hypothetical protein
VSAARAQFIPEQSKSYTEVTICRELSDSNQIIESKHGGTDRRRNMRLLSHLSKEPHRIENFAQGHGAMSDTPNSLTMVADRFYLGCLRWLVVADSGRQGTFGKEPGDLKRSIPLREGTNDGPQNRLLHCSRGASRREPMEFTFPSFRPACLLALHFQWEGLHVTGDNGSIL